MAMMPMQEWHSSTKNDSGTTLASLITFLGTLTENQKDNCTIHINNNASILKRMFTNQWGVFNLGQSAITMYFFNGTKYYERVYTLGGSTTTTTEVTITKWEASYIE